MKRLYSPKEKDDIMYELERLQNIIIRLKAKPYLSEYEFKTLQLAMQEFNHLRGIVNEH